MKGPRFRIETLRIGAGIRESWWSSRACPRSPCVARLQALRGRVIQLGNTGRGTVLLRCNAEPARTRPPSHAGETQRKKQHGKTRVRAAFAPWRDVPEADGVGFFPGHEGWPREREARSAGRRAGGAQLVRYWAVGTAGYRWRRTYPADGTGLVMRARVAGRDAFVRGAAWRAVCGGRRAYPASRIRARACWGPYRPRT